MWCKLFSLIIFYVLKAVICKIENKYNSFEFDADEVFQVKPIFTEEAPRPLGPYSQAVQFSRIIYTSGLLGMDNNTMKLVPGGAGAEAKQIMRNMRAILDEVNCNFANVLKTTVYLTDMNDFQIVNEKYKEHMREPFPARTTLEVSKLPLGAKVAIEAIVGYACLCEWFGLVCIKTIAHSPLLKVLRSNKKDRRAMEWGCRHSPQAYVQFQYRYCTHNKLCSDCWSVASAVIPNQATEKDLV